MWVQEFGGSEWKLLWVQESLVDLGARESGCSGCKGLAALGAIEPGHSGYKRMWLLWVQECGCSGCKSLVAMGTR